MIMFMYFIHHRATTQVDLSGKRAFPPLPIPPTIYKEIDHGRTATRKDTPPTVPPKMGRSTRDSGFDSGNITETQQTQGCVIASSD